MNGRSELAPQHVDRATRLVAVGGLVGKERAGGCLGDPSTRLVGGGIVGIEGCRIRKPGTLRRKSRTVRLSWALSGYKPNWTVHLTPGEPQRSAEGVGEP